MSKWYFMNMETMSLESNALILAIGIIVIPDFSTEYSFDYIKENLSISYKLKKTQQKGRDIDKNIVDYWNTEEHKELITQSNETELNVVYNGINQFYTNFEIDYSDVIWSATMKERFIWDNFCKFIDKPNFFFRYKWGHTKTAYNILNQSNNDLRVKYNKYFQQHDVVLNCALEYKILMDILKQQ